MEASKFAWWIFDFTIYMQDVVCKQLLFIWLNGYYSYSILQKLIGLVKWESACLLVTARFPPDFSTYDRELEN